MLFPTALAIVLLLAATTISAMPIGNVDGADRLGIDQEAILVGVQRAFRNANGQQAGSITPPRSFPTANEGEGELRKRLIESLVRRLREQRIVAHDQLDALRRRGVRESTRTRPEKPFVIVTDPRICYFSAVQCQFLHKPS